MRGFTVHAHFYQPPREDPLSGEIPLEIGASPYKNWNEKIDAESYQPNARLGNFKNISFNLGPTLARWMSRSDASTLQMIRDSDHENIETYGVGNAIAQPYNHTILPLGSKEDKQTQIYWGIADFEFRFGRKPKGMWLPETAVDYETLETLADAGIEFTILAPWQSLDNNIDTRKPYKVSLYNGKKIVAFFYNKDLSSSISFDPTCTENADAFVQNYILSQYLDLETPQLILMASDGELYGHHQHFRDYFLSRLLNGALSSRDIQKTFPELWLRDFPAEEYTEIKEKTAWSCFHDLGRWNNGCDCIPGEWKAPLSSSLALIAQDLDTIYFTTLAPLIKNPLELRNKFIHVINEQITIDELINEERKRKLSEEEIKKISLLLFSQYERQRMFTSCGWFFGDFDRIEPKNNVRYAAEAVYLANAAAGTQIIPYSEKGLEKVVSNSGNISAADIFNEQIRKIKQREKLN